jgi:hypothetical protein
MSLKLLFILKIPSDTFLYMLKAKVLLPFPCTAFSPSVFLVFMGGGGLLINTLYAFLVCAKSKTKVYNFKFVKNLYTILMRSNIPYKVLSTPKYITTIPPKLHGIVLGL